MGERSVLSTERSQSLLGEEAPKWLSCFRCRSHVDEVQVPSRANDNEDGNDGRRQKLSEQIPDLSIGVGQRTKDVDRVENNE